jgi:hypothetical protein
MAVCSRSSIARSKVVTAIVVGTLMLMKSQPVEATSGSLDDQ